MVQLFKRSESSIELVQTMDEHVGAVGQLLFTNSGEKLLSCSADRTVIIRERMTCDGDDPSSVAYILSRVITLKASPVSMTFPPGEPDILVLSTIDRHVQKFDIQSAKQLHSFRVVDPETTDTAVMSSLTVGRGGVEKSPKLLVGVSSTDKSIRIYDFEKDTLLAREFGHTEGVSDVLLFETSEGNPAGAVKRTLISCGLDGVIMVWNLSIQKQQFQENTLPVFHKEDETPSKELTAARPPLRRILSKSELAGFQRNDGIVSSPTPVRATSPPRIRKKISGYSLSSRLAKSGYNVNSGSAPSIPPRRLPPVINSSNGKVRSDRSVSPPSPKAGLPRTPNVRSSNHSLRRPSVAESRPRHHISKSAGSTSSNNSEFGSLNMSTEQVCRTLRAYRKKLSGSTDHIHAVNELERELDLTVRALGERAKRLQVNGENGTTSNITTGSAIKGKDSSSLPIRPSRIARRTPSTPNLRQTQKGKADRTNSLDADAEAEADGEG